MSIKSIYNFDLSVTSTVWRREIEELEKQYQLYCTHKVFAVLSAKKAGETVTVERRTKWQGDVLKS